MNILALMIKVQKPMPKVDDAGKIQTIK